MSKKLTQAYKGNGQHDWEDVTEYDDDCGDEVTRLRVPGGWLYRVATEDTNDLLHVNTVFVAMPEVVKHKV